MQRTQCEAGACVLGCLILLTLTILVLFVGGLLLRRPMPYTVPMDGRELRSAVRTTPVYFVPSTQGRVVARLSAGESVSVRPLSDGWVAVYPEEGAKQVLGFTPDSLLTAGRAARSR